MNKNFNYTPAEPAEPIVFEQIWAEKPGGGILTNCPFDAKKGDVAYTNDGKRFGVGQILYLSSGGQDDTYTLYDGSDKYNATIKGYSISDHFLFNGYLYKISREGDYDRNSFFIERVRHYADFPSVGGGSGIAYPAIYLGKNIKLLEDSYGAVKEYMILGTNVPANSGEQEVRLINGANLRKENVVIPDDVLAQLKGIHLV